MSPLPRRFLALAAAAALGVALAPAAAAGAAGGHAAVTAGTSTDAASTVADPADLVPTVQRWQPTDGTFTLGPNAAIVPGPTLSDRAGAATRAFADDLRDITGRPLPVADPGAGAGAGDVVLRVDPDLPPAPVRAGDAVDETYRLSVGDRVTITGISAAAVLRGMQTLQQLFTLSNGRRTLPAGTIDDWPRAGDRGVMLDAGRHYYQIPYIKQLIREMAWLKLNTLHLHLTEWNGFRLDSPKFPGLAAEQAYTKADIAEIERTAAAYGIEILPEIDLPAHATAITTLWPELNWDCPSMGTMFGTANFTMDVTKPETLQRTEELLDEFIGWFSGPRFHVGTDEYPTDAAQKACPELVDYAAEQGYGDTADVFVHFINEMNDIVRSHGKTTVIWDWWRYDQHPTIDVDSNITVEAWTNDGSQFIEDGYQVVVSHSAHFYTTPRTPPGGPLLPDTTWFTDDFEPQDDPAVRGYLISRWSDDAESQTDSYFDWFAHRAQQVLADRAWGAPSSASAFDIEGRIDRIGPPPGEPWRIQPDTEVLTGTTYASGPPWDSAGAAEHAFDGDPDSYVDLDDKAGYVGIDLGPGNAQPVSVVRFVPRGGSGLTRMIGGVFQGCSDGPDHGCHDLATVQWRTPRDWMELTVTDPTPYRWYRYVSPEGGHTNVAEIQFGTPPSGGRLLAELDAGSLTALGRNQLTLTLRNTGRHALRVADVQLLVVGADSFARRTVTLPEHLRPVRGGRALTVTGQIDVPLDVRAERVRLQATVTAEGPQGGLVLARASGQTEQIAPITATVDPASASPENGTTTATVTVTNKSAAPMIVTVRPQPPDGVQVGPKRSIVTVPAGRSADRAFRVSAADEPGVHTVPFAVSANARGQQTVVDPAPRLRLSVPFASLAAAANTHGITDDADPAPDDLGGGIDGDGSSYSWQALADVGVSPGGEVSHGGYTFSWPERGEFDSVLADRQTILVGASASGVGLLTTGAWGTVSGTGTITYTDGTSSDFTVTDPDWQTPTLPPDTEVALSMPYHNLAGTGRIDRGTYVYFHDVPADPDKTIASVTLPGSDQGGRYHLAVFSMALKG